MENKNKLFFSIYILAAIIIALAIVEDAVGFRFFRTVMDTDTVMWGAAFIGGIAGILAYSRSFRMLRYKLIPVVAVAATPWIVTFSTFCQRECMLPLIGMMMLVVIIPYIVLLVISTFIARKFLS
ncbi:MAG: hypothetical protein V4519_00130 [Patescibacteria group bacterium]